MINKRIATAIATGALLLNSFATPAFAATTLEVTGNGSKSDSEITLDLNKSNTVVQNNKANVSNNVDVKANTGKNDAKDNTGGDVNISTGDSDVAVAVKNMLNKNAASVNCCTGGDTEVKIGNNGSKSDNKVDLDMDNSNEIFQDNDAKVNNNVDVKGTTGKNNAKDNTNGDVSIETGDSDVSVGVLTFANTNFASIGGDDEEGGALSLWILGNGKKSDNNIDADLDNSSTVKQDNNAHVYNDVDVEAATGKNKADDNTGGEVSIETGDADVETLVANVGNFNWADLSCDCLFDDVTAKIANNGSKSDNKIDVDSEGSNELFQDNYAHLDNDIDEVEAATGDNKASDNTADNGDDPSIETGDAGVGAQVMNQFNANEAGIGGNFEFEFDWDEMFGSIFG